MKKVLCIIPILLLMGCNSNFITIEQAEKICNTNNGIIVKSKKDFLEYEIEYVDDTKLYSCELDRNGNILEQEQELIINTSLDYTEFLNKAKELTKADIIINISYDEGFEAELQDTEYRYEVEEVNNEVVITEKEKVEIR